MKTQNPKYRRKILAWMAVLLMLPAGGTVFAAEASFSADAPSSLQPLAAANTITVSDWAELQKAVNNASSNTVILVSDTILIPKDTTDTLNGKGRVTIRRAAGFAKHLLETNTRVHLTLENITLDGSGSTAISPLLLIDSGSLTLGTGAVLKNNKNTDFSGGGAGVYYDGVLYLDGGTISNCSANYYGGGVYVSGGSFYMESGSIQNCSGTLNGGGVYVAEDPNDYDEGYGYFGMNGGTISGCSANDGGGIYVNTESFFEMKNGTISNCSAKNTGGGVLVYQNGIFDLYNGSIIQCKATVGGGVLLWGGFLDMMGGTIGGSVAHANQAKLGGGIFMITDDLLLNGSDINLSYNSGEDIYTNYPIQVGEVPKKGGTIQITPSKYEAGLGILYKSEYDEGTFSKNDLQKFSITREEKSNDTAQSWLLSLNHEKNQMVLKAGSITAVEKPAATGLALDSPTLTLTPGTTGLLHSTVSPSTASSQVTWKSSNESVAKVDETGKVSAIKMGESIISASTANGKTASCKVLVASRILTLDTTSANLVKGGQYQFLLRNHLANATYTATTDSAGIALVVPSSKTDPRGQLFTISGLQPGSTIIKVAGSDGSAVSFPVRVYSGSILLDTNRYTMAPGDRYDIGITLQGISEKNLRVSSSRDGCATVTRLSENRYRVTGRNLGYSYIVFDVLDDSGKIVNHASIRVDVQTGVKQHGEATRSFSYIP